MGTGGEESEGAVFSGNIKSGLVFHLFTISLPQSSSVNTSYPVQTICAGSGIYISIYISHDNIHEINT